jgi:cytochrome c-type biogenesis protein CcmH/NrfG
MPELAIATVVLAVAAGVLIVAPLRTGHGSPLSDAVEREAAEVRHRVAIEALRDVEADRRAGSLNEAGYAAELAAAEERAATTRAALDATSAAPGRPSPGSDGRQRRTAVVAAAGIGLLLIGGTFVPPPIGFASQPVVNEAALAAQRGEEARQDRIAELSASLRTDPTNVDALSDLADAYLAGTTSDDLARAATALLLIVNLEPNNQDAYRRIITAYIRAGDYADARAALSSFADLDPDRADVAFFTGLIALREGDPSTATDSFDRFLRLAPDDDRAAMVRALRADTAQQSPAP